MRLLITGATGFLGNALLDALADGCRHLTVFVLPGDHRIAALRARGVRDIREGDVGDPTAVEEAVAGHTHVIHLAGLISYWGRDRQRLWRVNRDGVANVVAACLRHRVRRLVHVSSVGAVGFFPDGRLADEDTPFNWPESFPYMTSKRAGQLLVEEAVRDRGLDAVILNPASLMGPGDPDPRTPHNQLYRSIHRRGRWGCFAGGLAVTDVRDLAAIAIQALDVGAAGERFLVVGANVTYAQVVRSIGACFARPVHPFAVPAPLLAAAGGLLEVAGAITGRRPVLTAAYGRLSGWRAYYSNARSVRAFGHAYLPLARTIEDGCRYYLEHHADGTGGVMPRRG